MTDKGHAPDGRDIDDISAADRCDYCEWEPAAIILVEGSWQCYNCGQNPDNDSEVRR